MHKCAPSMGCGYFAMCLAEGAISFIRDGCNTHVMFVRRMVYSSSTAQCGEEIRVAVEI